jgi:hypothetical protein
MLNLNYNINPSKGPGNCRGEVKFNYSASLLVVGGGGGGATGAPGGPRRSGGGGGGAGVYSGSLSIIPNVTYNITVGTAGIGGGIVSASNGTNGQTSSFVGYDDNDTNPLTITTTGGFGGQFGNGTVGGVGGNSGISTINGLIISSSRVGGAGGELEGGGGGGASIIQNGLPGSSQSGGNGGLAIYAPLLPNPDYTVGGGGGGGAATPTNPAGQANPISDPRSGGNGGGVNGTGVQSGQSGASYGGGGGGGASANAPGGFGAGGDGSNGVVIIRYAGEPKAFVTNATTTTSGGFTTHLFNTGSGTFLYTYPYPWPDVVPYTVEVCPDEHNEDVRPEIYWDYSYTTNLNRFPAVSPFVSSSYATMSISADNTNCTNVVSTNNSSFTTNAQSTVIPSLTGSNWPKSGSVTMSISVAGITYDPLAVNQFYSSSFSASSTVYNSNPSITGSILTSSFVASEFYRFYVNANLVHNYGVAIPTGGLIQYLDASNPASYPGSGSIWYDISGYNHNMSSSFGATFPTWDSSSQYFNFNGTSNAVSTYMTSSLSTYSMVVWAKIGDVSPPTSSRAGGAYSIVSGSDSGQPSSGLQFDSLTYSETLDQRWEIATEQNQRDVYSNVTETDTTEFLMIAMTNAGLSGSQNLYRATSYQPPVIVNSDSPSPNYGNRGDSYTGSLMIVGNRYYNVTGSFQGYAPEGFYTGSIAGVLFYNRALSANEITDIWNAGI